LIDQSGYNRRLHALAPQIGRCINYLAWISPSFGDRLRLLDSTPVPCGQSRETTRPLGVRRLRRLRALRQPQPLVLGLSALPDPATRSSPTRTSSAYGR
jgi:hypothetical protein